MSKDSDNEFLALNWRLLRTEPGQIQSPEKTDFPKESCRAVHVPGSLFEQFQDASDNCDWWYLCDFELPTQERHTSFHLILERLATVCEVWLNGSQLAAHANMFIPLCLSLDGALRSQNSLFICFRSLTEQLKTKRPRPRWKTNLVKNQQLRWFRTSLLGHIPGWTPSTPPIGICGSARIEKSKLPRLVRKQLTTSINENVGHLTLSCELNQPADKLSLSINAQTYTLATEEGSNVYTVEITIEDPMLWWPHTHGKPALHPYKLQVTTDSNTDTIATGQCGFRSIQYINTSDQTTFVVNGTPVFCRGACWTIQNISSFQRTERELEQLVQKARDANINMLRVGGTMEYESDAFYDLCDKHGIMVWQDFMFANMDYPFEDEIFLAKVTHEASYQARRLLTHPCIAILCGNSELAQQAAMMGIKEQDYSHDFFHRDLPALCEAILADVNYVPTTPSGGALPFHVSSGLTHFYGVGAYKMQLAESGADRVKFTPETLGFSHVPDAREVEAMFDHQTPACHTPLWKNGVPRDSGAGWDFEDIRDDYLTVLYDVNAVNLRSRDTLKYLELSRSTTGELIAQTINLWRSSFSSCQGALLWFYKDIVAGAGWGLLTHQGQEKPAFYYAKRAFSPLSVSLIDQGLDGVYASLINDTNRERTIRLQVDLIATPNTIVDHHEETLVLGPHSSTEENVEALLGKFRDPSDRYQFGPKQYDIVMLHAFENQAIVSQSCHFLGSLALPNAENPNIEICYHDDEQEKLTITSDVFLHTVCLEIPGYDFSDNYFHLAPNIPRSIEVRAQQSNQQVLKGFLSAINLKNSVRVRFPRSIS